MGKNMKKIVLSMSLLSAAAFRGDCMIMTPKMPVICEDKASDKVVTTMTPEMPVICEDKASDEVVITMTPKMPIICRDRASDKFVSDIICDALTRDILGTLWKNSVKSIKDSGADATPPVVSSERTVTSLFARMLGTDAAKAMKPASLEAALALPLDKRLQLCGNYIKPYDQTMHSLRNELAITAPEFVQMSALMRLAIKKEFWLIAHVDHLTVGKFRSLFVSSFMLVRKLFSTDRSGMHQLVAEKLSSFPKEMLIQNERDLLDLLHWKVDIEEEYQTLLTELNLDKDPSKWPYQESSTPRE
jgi:hypothetical protein